MNTKITETYPSHDPSGRCTFLQYSSPFLSVDLCEKVTTKYDISFV